VGCPANRRSPSKVCGRSSFRFPVAEVSNASLEVGYSPEFYERDCSESIGLTRSRLGLAVSSQPSRYFSPRRARRLGGYILS
jgi:hypothetical protein